MSPFDRRLTPARPDLAAAHLRGLVVADRFVEGEPARVAAPVAPLRAAPDPQAMLDTELLLGEDVLVYDRAGGFAFVQSARDGYVGYVPEAALAARGAEPTHRVAALATHLYPGPNIKLPPLARLPMNARLAVAETAGPFAVLDDGRHAIAAHLAPLARPEPDFVAVAERHVGVPYLWGGRTGLGLDCSGLVQTALEAAGIAAPRDTDMQERALGEPFDLAPDLSNLARGDLVFWKGHVGIMAGPAELLHANGHHMAVVREPVAEAAARIAQNAYGRITSARRLWSAA